MDVTPCFASPEPGVGREDHLALMVLIWEGRLVAVVLAAFRRCFSAPESSRLFVFSHGRPFAMLILSFPLCMSAGRADRAAVLPSCTPAEMQAAPRQESGSHLGCLDPALDAWIPSTEEIKAIVVLALGVIASFSGCWWAAGLCNEAQVAVVHCRCKFYWSCMIPETWIFLSATCWLSGY